MPDGVTCVKVVTLPGLPPKGDASDWIAAGGTKQCLLELVGGAAPYSPRVTPESEKASDEEESLAKRGRHTAADRLVELALTSGAVLFHDQRCEPYVVFIHKERR